MKHAIQANSILLFAATLSITSIFDLRAELLPIGNSGFDWIFTDSSMSTRATLSSSTKSLRNPYYVGFWTQTTTAWDWWCGINPANRAYMNTRDGRSVIEQVLPDTLQPGIYVLSSEVWCTDGDFALNVSVDLVAGGTTLTPISSSSPTPALFTNEVWTRRYEIASTNPLVNLPMKVRLGAGSGVVASQRQVAFDNIRLERNPGSPGAAEPLTIGNSRFDGIYADSTMASRISLSGSTKSLRSPYYVGFWTQTTTAWDWWCGVSPSYRVYMNTQGGRSVIEQVLPNLLRPGTYRLSSEVWRTDGTFALNVSVDLVAGRTTLVPDTSSSSEPTLGTNTVWSRCYRIPVTNALIGLPLCVRLGAGSGTVNPQRQVAFDQVELAWIPPSIGEIAVTNGIVSLNMDDLILGATNAIQRTSCLMDGQWTNVHTFIPGNASTNWSDSPDSGQNSAFYRIWSGW